MTAVVEDLDFLCARLHARRARLFDAERLAALCRLRSLSELGAALGVSCTVQDVPSLERQLVEAYLAEHEDLVQAVHGRARPLLQWLGMRWLVQELEQLLAVRSTPDSTAELRSRSITLLGRWGLPFDELAQADSPRRLTQLLARCPATAPFAEALRNAKSRAVPWPLLIERAYHGELLSRAERLGGEDGERVNELVFQELDTFHLMLALRARRHHGLGVEVLLPLHVSGTRIRRGRFREMLESPSAPACAALALRCALDRLPSGAPADSDGEYASQVEPLCWQRAQRLAARHFRASHLGVATVVAYSALRRIELSHLRAVTEALARGGDAHVLETRLGLRGTPEVARA